MATRPKSRDIAERMVTIVGLNHGLCLQTFLSRNGWKEEKFVDVVFLCIPHSKDETAITSAASQRQLKANRSVLAAASPFFAKVLPDYQQDEDCVITVEYTYEELFPILEYVYSGKLVCSEEKREKILSIISELKINIAQSEVQKHSEIPGEDDCCIVQPVETSYGKDNVIESPRQSRTTALLLADQREDTPIKCQGPRIRAEHEAEKILVQKTDTTYIKARPPKSSELPRPVKLRKYPGKKNVQRTMLLAINKQFNAELPLGTAKVASNDLKANDFTLTAPVDSQTATYDAFDEDMGLYTSAELLNDTQIISESSKCNLLNYVYDTWDYGVYSPVNLVKLAMQYIKETKRSYKLRSTPSTTQASHSHTPIVSEAQNHSNGVRASAYSEVPFSDPDVIIIPDSIQIWKDSSRVLVPSVSNDRVKSKTRVEESAEGNTSVENDADYTDLALAQHFLNEERRRKKTRQMRVRMILENLNQYKEVARKILSAKKKIKTQMSEAETAKPKTRPKAERRKSRTRCETCGKMYVTSKLHIHQLIHDPNSRTRCEICGKMVITKMLHIHQLTHSDVKSHLCDYCGRAFTLKKYLLSHIKTQHEDLERKFICNSCGFSFKRKKELEVHERIHSGERPYVCKYCDKTFRESGSLARHIRTHTGEKPYPCNICGTAYAVKDTYIQHYRRRHAVRPDGSTGVRIYRCDPCGKTFHRLLAYEQHRATHTGGVAAVRCNEPNCTFTYSDIAQLKDHLSTAHPGKTYTCSICSKVFLSKPSLLEHEMKHDPSKHFRCSMCPKIVTSKKGLAVHKKTHTRATPYECSVCNAKFHSRSLVSIHMRKHEPPGGRMIVTNRAGNSVEAPL